MRTRSQKIFDRIFFPVGLAIMTIAVLTTLSRERNAKLQKQHQTVVSSATQTMSHVSAVQNDTQTKADGFDPAAAERAKMLAGLGFSTNGGHIVTVTVKK